MCESTIERNSEYFRLIREAIEAHKLAFMIGAGVSRATDGRNPSWPDLIKTLQGALSNCDEDDYLKVAQLYYIKYGALNLKNTVQSQFPSKAIPGEFQKNILDLNPHYIITTNWDCYFDNLVSENILYPYDVIANDRELVESKNDNKIIKMHGDFSHGNYVFTEDDYLNYSNNFPLIENYVKSVFSTHAIVMLGYSFNDIDLKQIVTWFQNHSDQQPPIYMIVYNRDDYKQQYLEKFGIKSIVVENANPTEGLRTFLNTLKSDAETYASNPSFFVNYKLKGFERLNKVLQSHLPKSLTNCGIDYLRTSDVLLHFYDSFMSSGYDERKRKIYREFVEKFEPNEQNNKIVSILLKAGVSGIMSSKDNEPVNYIPFAVDDKNESIFTFLDDVVHEDSDEIIDIVKYVVFLYNRGELERAYEKNEELLILCKKTHCYEWLLIGIYNRDVLLRELQSNVQLRKKYLNKKTENIETLFFRLPNDVQRNNLYLRDFLLGKDLNEMFFYVSQVVEKKNEQVYCIENGGACYDADSLKYEHEHQNLIEFVIGNGLCMENDVVYRNLCNKYVEVAFVRKRVQKIFSLNKVELFTCIKYLPTKSLRNYLRTHVFINKNVKIAFDKELLDWLIDDAFAGLVNLFRDKHDVFIEYDKCILHALILLSLNELDDTQTHKIFGLMSVLVSKSLNTPIIFEAINTFFANQWYLYQKKYDDQEIIDMLVNLLNRFVVNDVNVYEYEAICKHGSSNMLNLTEYLTKKIESVSLIKRIILIVDDEKDEKEKVSYCESILLSLYGVSNDECQKEISNYLMSLDFIPKSNDVLMKIRLLNYKIKLIVVGIKNNIEDLLKELNEFIDTFNTNTMYSEFNYTFVLFNSLVEKEKNSNSKILTEILDTQEKLKKIIEKSNSTEGWLSCI